MVDAIILAGTTGPTALTEAERVANKAFIRIGERIMLQYVHAALKQAAGVGRIAVVGPEAEIKACLEDQDVLVVQEGKTIVENVKHGVEALQPEGYFLVCSADIPFLTPGAVEDLISACNPFTADFYYPIVERGDNDKRFPGVRRTYVKLAEGEFTGGNIILVNPGCLELALPRLERVFALRKSPLKLAALLGFGFLVKLFFRKLTINELEKRFSELFAVTGKAVVSRYPEIGTDVDKLSDLALARRLL
ncbi:MAG: NTP transferase domain-containing protein [Firmicutes bacterium]|nr:NTP transferase domain-containing protein [Bacillota bacterium]